MKKWGVRTIIVVLLFGILMVALRKQVMLSRQQDQKQQLTKAVQKRLRQAHFQGTALLLDNGKIRTTVSLGYLNQAATKRNSATTSFPIASIQKLVTATLIAQLVAKHQLSYSAKVRTYLPESGAPATVTIRQLMEHQAGVRMDEVAPSKILTTQKEQEQFVYTSMKWTNDKSYHYSNANYSLLAAILSKITKQSYEQLVQKNMIQKLKLTHSFFWDSPKVASNSPVAYRYDALADQSSVITADSFAENKALFSSLFGAGNLFMSAGDLARLIQGLQNNQLLTQQQYQEMTNDFAEGYWSGFWVKGRQATALGELGAYQAIVYGPVGFQQAVILLANQVGSENINDLAASIEEIGQK